MGGLLNLGQFAKGVPQGSILRSVLFCSFMLPLEMDAILYCTVVIVYILLFFWVVKRCVFGKLSYQSWILRSFYTCMLQL